MRNRAPLTKSVKQHVPDTLANIIETIFGSAQSYQTETPKTTPAKKTNRGNKNDNEYYDIVQLRYTNGYPFSFLVSPDF